MKVKVDKKTILMAHPVLVVGAYDRESRPNMMTVSWGGICATNPPCVAVSIRKATYTYDGLDFHKAFTVNIPPANMVKEADFAGTVSGRDINKFDESRLTPVKSSIVNAPYIEEFPISLMCKLVNKIEIGSHTQFIGEILEVIADEEVLDEKKLPIIERVNPFIYDTASRAYYGINEKLLDGFTTRDCGFITQR